MKQYWLSTPLSLLSSCQNTCLHKCLHTCLTLCLTLPLAAAADDLPRLIHVNAQGYVEAIPDQLMLSVTAKATRLSYEEAKQAVDDITTTVLKAAREAGVAEEDLDSSQLNAFRETRWDEKRRQQVYTGDAVQRNITMTLKNPEAYPDLLTALSKLDLHNIGRPVLQHARLEALRDSALRSALDNAKRKAELMAAQMDVAVGTVYSMSDTSGGSAPQPHRARYAMAMADAESAAASAEAISFGKQKIFAQVSVSFEIELPD